MGYAKTDNTKRDCNGGRTRQEITQFNTQSINQQVDQSAARPIYLPNKRLRGQHEQHALMGFRVLELLGSAEVEPSVKYWQRREMWGGADREGQTLKSERKSDRKR